MVGGISSDEDALEAIASAHPQKIMILTAGSKGSIAWHQGTRYIQPPQWIAEAVDTTGCGDAFRAGFILEYKKSGDIQKSLLAGTTLASSVAGYIGAF